MTDGAWLAIHAAAEENHRRQRAMHEREEEMTRYSPEDLNENWEFKIVRSETGAFRQPEVFATLLEEEALAGWEMVEKLDDRRVRFKRSREARSRDHRLPPGLDPYRTRFGRASSPQLVLVITGLLLALGLGMGLFLFSAGADAPIIATLAVFIPFVIMLIGIGAVVAARRR